MGGGRGARGGGSAAAVTASEGSKSFKKDLRFGCNCPPNRRVCVIVCVCVCIVREWTGGWAHPAEHSVTSPAFLFLPRKRHLDVLALLGRLFAHDDGAVEREVGILEMASFQRAGPLAVLPSPQKRALARPARAAQPARSVVVRFPSPFTRSLCTLRTLRTLRLRSRQGFNCVKEVKKRASRC